MNNTPAVLNYRDLLADIGRLYEGARQTVAETYWKIGQRLVEVEQSGAKRAKYGENLLERLSHDLSAKYGRGFSADNLERMRHLYLAYPKSATSRKLVWSQYVELLPVRDKDIRKRLERRAEAEDLSSRELRELARREADHPAPGKAPAATRTTPLRRPANLKLRTCKLADAPGLPVPDEHILVDCGFQVYRLIPKTTGGFELTSRPSYTYAAIVERVVDGDTVWALIDLGFDTVVREKLRLHGIDTPEVTTPEGKEARDYVSRLLPPGTPVVVRSYASDAYGRFVADILYLQEPVTHPSPGTFEEIAARGVFLNKELLAKGFAVRMVG